MTITTTDLRPEVRTPTQPDTPSGDVVLDVADLAVYYGDFKAVADVTMQIRQHEIFAMIENPKTHVYMCGLRGMEPGIDEAMTAAAAAKGLDWAELRPQLKKADRWHVETY